MEHAMEMIDKIAVKDASILARENTFSTQKIQEAVEIQNKMLTVMLEFPCTRNKQEKIYDTTNRPD